MAPLLAGLASHHAGCLPAWKALLERCFQQGLLKVYAPHQQPFDPCSWLLAGCCIAYDLFDVFDGHSGKQAVSFASKHVLPLLQESGENAHTAMSIACSVNKPFYYTYFHHG